jgi:cellulose synthase/poly-beta-1,6-N-acetylglucosamine synthase-like glycosyltransferase
MNTLDLCGVTAISLLVATWVGYPAIVHAMARLTRRGSIPFRPYAPKVSVLIATREEPSQVDAKIDSILASDYPVDQLEILVAFDLGTHRHIPALRNSTDPRVVTLLGDAPGGKAASLNAAARRATGDVMVFTDTRQLLSSNTIRELVLPLLDPSVGAISGALALGAERRGSPIKWYWDMEVGLRIAEAQWHSAVGVSGSLYAMRRALWAPLPAGLILDDLYTPMRLVLEGRRVMFCPDAVVHETRRTTPSLEYQRKVRTLAGNVQLCMWLPAVLRPDRNPIWFQFVFHKLMRLATPLLAAVTGMWLAALAWRFAGPNNLVIAGLTLALVAAAIAVLPPLRVLREAFVWGAYRVSAAGIGVVHGMRRQWDVWR